MTMIKIVFPDFSQSGPSVPVAIEHNGE